MKPFKQFLLEQANTIAILPGGFKPPHKGHFEALKYLITQNNASTAIVYIGKKERDSITADMSYKIWEIYKKYLPIQTSIEISPITPVKSVYDFIDKNPTGNYVVGAGEEDLERYSYFNKHKDKYPNTKIVAIPPQFGRISGTQTRDKILNKDADALTFIPGGINLKDINSIKHILNL